MKLLKPIDADQIQLSGSSVGPSVAESRGLAPQERLAAKLNADKKLIGRPQRPS